MSEDTSGEPNLYEYLRQVPEVFALVGARIYYKRIPQHVFEDDRVMDCVVYQRAGGIPAVGFCGSDGLIPGQYQIDVYSPDSQRMANIARAIRDALVDYSGLMGSAFVQTAQLASEFDSDEPEPGLERRTQTFNIWYVEG